MIRSECTLQFRSQIHFHASIVTEEIVYNAAHVGETASGPEVARERLVWISVFYRAVGGSQTW